MYMQDRVAPQRVPWADYSIEELPKEIYRKWSWNKQTPEARTAYEKAHVDCVTLCYVGVGCGKYM